MQRPHMPMACISCLPGAPLRLSVLLCSRVSCTMRRTGGRHYGTFLRSASSTMYRCASPSIGTAALEHRPRLYQLRLIGKRDDVNALRSPQPDLTNTRLGTSHWYLVCKPLLFCAPQPLAACLQVYPKQVDPAKDPSKIDVDIMVKERPMRTAEVECEWAIAPDDAGRPSVVSLVPGALQAPVYFIVYQCPTDAVCSISVTTRCEPAAMHTAPVVAYNSPGRKQCEQSCRSSYPLVLPGCFCDHNMLHAVVAGGQMIFEHRNLQKKGRQLTANLSAQNFLLPREDLGFRVEYKQPYLWGPGDPHRAALVFSAFNSRKLSGVFTPGASKPSTDTLQRCWPEAHVQSASIW